MKWEDENMLACVEMIKEENKRIMREGIIEKNINMDII